MPSVNNDDDLARFKLFAALSVVAGRGVCWRTPGRRPSALYRTCCAHVLALSATDIIVAR